MQIVLATHNKGKMSEINNLLSSSYEVLTLDHFPNIKEIPETGKTLKENAFIKARTVFEMTGLPSLADDTGLEVESLGGDPGVYSARYAGEDSTDKENINKVLLNLEGKSDRKAKFVCAISFYWENFSTFPKIFRGECFGTILKKPLGEKGFGYDPIFYYEKLDKTFADLSENEKNTVSHRALAMKELLSKLNF